MKNSISLLLSVFCATTVFAAPQLIKVVAVGPDSITVQTRDKAGVKVTNIDSEGNYTAQGPSNIVKYRVSKFTDITVDGLPGKLSDVHAGMMVSVTSDMTPTDAAAIVASTIPPAGEGPPLGKNGQPVSKWESHKITLQKVLSVGTDRLTVAEDGAAKAVAYLVRPSTVITVNGKPGTLAGIQAGMIVEVNASDSHTAASIQASNAGARK
jgi:hypothetical protein